jgi:hypothetical protein
LIRGTTINGAIDADFHLDFSLTAGLKQESKKEAEENCKIKESFFH